MGIPLTASAAQPAVSLKTTTVAKPVIGNFVATPAKIKSGDSATLTWTVTGATSLTIAPGIGATTKTSYVVKPTTTTIYTLTDGNSAGCSTATVTVTVGIPPTITSFTRSAAMFAIGQSSTLSWAVTGSPTLTLSPGGALTGTSLVVNPTATTTYTLTAANAFGSATASVAITVGSPPAITSFTASPASVAAGQATTLAWVVTGSPGLMLNPVAGPVTGTSVSVKPTATTTYTLSATNSFGSVTAKVTATVLPANPPVIGNFFANPATAGPGVTATLHWVVSGATSTTIDNGVGTVTGSSVNVSPSATTTYTLTATGTQKASATVTYYPLRTVSSSLFYSEHAIFVIPAAGLVDWAGSNSWSSVFSTANVNSYIATLKNLFPDDYAFVVVTANNLLPNNVPSVQPQRHTADGIGLLSTGVGVPSICRYNIGGGTVIDGTPERFSCPPVESFGTRPRRTRYVQGASASLAPAAC